MSSLPGRIVLLLPALLMLAGCATPKSDGADSVLVLPRLPPDSCVLEVFFVRFPFGNPEVNQRLWEEIDEQHFPAELRRRLGQNGFRVGLVGGQIPVALSKLLELEDKPAPAGAANRVNLADLDSQPRVMRQHLSIGAGQRKQIVASGVYDQLPVLLREPDRLSGQTYRAAQAMLAVETFPLGDGRVRVELVPELHHDQPRQRWVGSQGMFRLEPGRPREVFPQMALSATLSPGSMLVISSLPQLPGSLGHYFFTEDHGNLEQKLLVLRLSQTQHDGLFTPSEGLQRGQ